MATVNLGKIKLKWRGTWSSGGSYTADDVVEYTDGSVTSSYIAVASSSNQAPSSGGTVNTTYWNLAAKGQASSPTTTQGDLIVRGASADERLAIGSAGQALKVNGAGNGFVFGSAGAILQLKQVKTTAYVTSGSSFTDITGLSITITPTNATTQMMLIPNISTYHATGSTQYSIRLDSSNSTIHYVCGDFWSPGSGVSGNITQFYLDDHNTTNAITYKVQHKHYSGAGGTNKDWSGNLNGVSTFTVIELDSSVIS